MAIPATAVRPDPLGRDLLGDGKIDPGDAPMPSARIDFTIAPNSGAPTDISGVGSFTEGRQGSVPGPVGLNDAER